MFETQAEAKQFLVQKVLQQAEFEGIPMSQAERRMLEWSESDPDFDLSPEDADALVDELASEIPDDLYEFKIGGLLARSYERDVAAEGSLKGRWTAAYLKLNEGDHYISVMLDQALGRALVKKRPI